MRVACFGSTHEVLARARTVEAGARMSIGIGIVG
jgi:hypothetical protein